MGASMTQAEWQEFVEKEAEKKVEEWFTKNNWVPTEGKVIPSIAAFRSGVQFCENNLSKHPRVARLICALMSFEGAAYHSSTCEAMQDFNDDECSCGREEAVEEVYTAIKAFEEEV